MKIFDDPVDTMNRSIIQVQVLSTYDLTLMGADEDRIADALCPEQDVITAGLPDEDINRFANINSGTPTSFNMEPESRLQRLRDEGKMLGGDEFYMTAYLPLKAVVTAYTNREPMRLSVRKDMLDIQLALEIYIEKYKNAGNILDPTLPSVHEASLYNDYISNLCAAYFPDKSVDEFDNLTPEQQFTLGG